MAARVSTILQSDDRKLLLKREYLLKSWLMDFTQGLFSYKICEKTCGEKKVMG